MENTARVLILENTAADLKLIRHELEKTGLNVLDRCVSTKEDFMEQLDKFHPDLVLCDYILPTFSGLAALKLVQKKHAHLPFIFVSWQIHEQSVIHALKKGATDYVFKEQLSRLTLSVHRALREAEERKELDKVHIQIRKSEEYFRSLIENAMDIITVLDRSGIIRYASPSVKKVLGYEPEVLQGKNILDFIHPEDIGDARYVFLEADAKAELSTEFRFQHKNGQWRDLEAIGKILPEESGEVRTIVNSRDITDRVLEQQALKESILRHLKTQTELQKTQAKIIKQERLAAIGQMASGIAHDFSNSLMPVLGFSEILLNHPLYLDDKQKSKQYLEMINTSARDAMDIVGRLREFYRVKDKAESLVPLNLNKIIQQAVMLTQPKWKVETQAKGITVHATTELAELPDMVGNETALREALTNIIFNAVDAMPRGGNIHFKSRLDNAQIVLEISDDGIGMSEEVRGRCFEPFFSTKGKSGTGLGLAMVYGVMRRHEGSIDIKSQPGKGTELTLRFPITNIKKEEKAVPLSNLRHVSSMRILVVDDEPLVREVVREYLSQDGHKVETACDGSEAFEKFKKGDFELVITDRAMPEMSGDQLAEKIKKHSPKMPVIMLTGFGELMKVKGEQPKDVDLVLSKPLTLSACREAILRVISSV